MRNLIASSVLWILTSSLANAAEPLPSDILPSLYHQWEHIRYELPENKQEPAYAKLKAEADKWVSRDSRNAELLIWKGIITSTYAGAAGGLGALGAVKEARAAFEQALQIDPEAFGGSAYTSLGSLYYQVPGWPISFGDDDKAESLLKQGLAINPTGMDANYFYADFLYRQQRYAEAREYLARARQAPPRPERPLADKGRLHEIDTLQQALDQQVP